MNAEVLVLGGGPSGAATAAGLARAGRDVLVLEREREPTDKVCGEFLAREALPALKRLGIDVLQLGAVPIHHVTLVRGKSRTTHRLPFPAASLSRRILDEALLKRARDLGARVCRGERVASLEGDGSGWRAELAHGGALQSQRAVLAVGKHDLRGWKRPPVGQVDLVGFKMHWRLAKPLSDEVELHLFPGGYAGLQPVEGGFANLCLLVRKATLARMGGWPELLAAIRGASPLLDQRLSGAVPRWDRPLATAGLPYGFVARSSAGLYRVGDQAAVIPSFAGEGLAIALRSASRAVEAISAGESAQAFQCRLHAELAPPVARAALLSQLLVRSGAQRLLSIGAGLVPGLLGLTADATRIAPNIAHATLSPWRYDP